jgi:hypothetical protein
VRRCSAINPAVAGFIVREVSIWCGDEPAVLDLDPYALSGREAGLLKPHAGDAQPRKKPWCTPVLAGFRFARLEADMARCDVVGEATNLLAGYQSRYDGPERQGVEAAGCQ